MKIHTLLVEDNLSLAETVISFFDLEDIDCDYAATGPQGLELALANDYQAILLDINLPRMNGLEVPNGTLRVSGFQPDIKFCIALGSIAA